MDQRPHSEFLRRLQNDLDALESRSQLRRLEILPTLNFCSNDYLGLSTDAQLRDALRAAIGAGNRVASTGSRLLSGHASVWGTLEDEFAEFAGAEAALYFNSGYAANTALFGCLLKSDDVVFSDSANHASIIDGIRLSGARKVIFPHLDLNALESELRRAVVPGHGQRFVAVESVFSMNGDRAPITALAELAERHGAELIVDEAHATGVLGPRGRGLVAEADCLTRVAAVVHTCGKALAAVGAFVTGSKVLKEYLINHARPFIFSTAMPPYVSEQARAALHLAAGADAARARLAALGAQLRTRLREGGIDIAGSDSQIVPAVLGENDRALAVASRLRADGFAVRAVRPPTVPEGTARLRLSLTAKHTQEMIDQLADSLLRACKEVPLSQRQAG